MGDGHVNVYGWIIGAVIACQLGLVAHYLSEIRDALQERNEK